MKVDVSVFLGFQAQWKQSRSACHQKSLCQLQVGLVTSLLGQIGHWLLLTPIWVRPNELELVQKEPESNQVMGVKHTQKFLICHEITC